MKKCMVLAVLLITAAFFMLQVNVPADENPAPYIIKVTSSEVKNRIVESHVRGHRVLADQPVDFEGDDLGPTPPEYLAIAYGSCVVSTLRFLAVLNKKEIQNIRVRVEGEVDFSKIMGLETSSRAGFSGLKIFISFDSAMSRAEQKSFVKKAMELGAVLDNVFNRTNVLYELAE